MFDTNEFKRLLKFSQIVAVVLALFLIAQTLYAFKLYTLADRSTPPTNVVTVNGEAEVFAAPDTASFTFGVQAEAKTVTEAQTNVTEKIDKALKLLNEAGIDGKDIKTLSYNIYPKYQYENFPCTQFNCPLGRQKLIGYEVAQTISVKVRKIADAGEILESLGTTEVTNVSGLEFKIDDEAELKAEARAQAIADAQSKAKVLAKNLGVRLGRVVNFYESSDSPYLYREGFGFEGDGTLLQSAPAKAELPAGENKIISNVSITFELR